MGKGKRTRSRRMNHPDPRVPVVKQLEAQAEGLMDEAAKLRLKALSREQRGKELKERAKDLKKEIKEAKKEKVTA